MTQQELKVSYLPLSEIHADEGFNCRGAIRPIDVVDLAKGIALHGLIQPVTVAPYTEGKDDAILKTGKKYRLLAGFRRFMAHRVNKMETIAAIIRQDMMDEATARIFNLAENLQREDLSIIQEAKALEKLHSLGVSEADTGNRLGKSRGWVQVRYMLLGLPDPVQKEVEAGFITQNNIRELYAIYKTAGEEPCFDAVRKLKDAKIKGVAGMSVNPNVSKPTSKHHRKRNEIFVMMDHIQGNIGNSFATRCLAWCAGELTNVEIFAEIKATALSEGKIYKQPEEDGILV
jgi:ParB/RepB/Spo0J family partition protein